MKIALIASNRLSRIMRVPATFAVALVSALLSSQAAAELDPNWVRQIDPSTAYLYSKVWRAERGEKDRDFSAAVDFAKGTGSPEGPKPLAAAYWFERAAAAGNPEAIEFLAVLHAVGDGMPRDEVLAKRFLEQHYANAGPSKTKAAEHGCGKSTACRDYKQLIASYFRLYVAYPRSARRSGLEGKFDVKVTLKDKRYTVSGDPYLVVFEPAIREVMDRALQRVPMPDGLAAEQNTLVFPLDFQLRGESMQ